MDWKKYFGTADRDESDKHNFKKFENDDEDDDFSDLETFFNEFSSGSSIFGFKGFNPSMLKQFQDILEAIEDLNRHSDGTIVDDEQRQKMFDKYQEFKDNKKKDTDLDDKIYTEQLDSLLKRISPDLMIKEDCQPSRSEVIYHHPGRKLTDEEKIMDMIHGTYKEEIKAPATQRPARKGHVQKAPLSPNHHFGVPPFHEFPPSSGGVNKSWNKTVISIRKSDGTYETRKLERSSDGTMKTTITKTDVDGNKSTKTFLGDEQQKMIAGANEKKLLNANTKPVPFEERNLIIQDGYKIPCLF